jgi:hypothetical protein
MIRASGGKISVTVRKDTEDYSGESLRAYFRRKRGSWSWSVPQPKGHPRTPKFGTLHGWAHTQEEALMDGLHRLREIYGETS